jgi:hypothetical protein
LVGFRLLAQGRARTAHNISATKSATGNIAVLTRHEQYREQETIHKGGDRPRDPTGRTSQIAFYLQVWFSLLEKKQSAQISENE